MTKKTRRSREIGNIDNQATILKVVSSSNASLKNDVGVLTQVAVPVQDCKILSKLPHRAMVHGLCRMASKTVVATIGNSLTLLCEEKLAASRLSQIQPTGRQPKFATDSYHTTFRFLCRLLC